MFAMTSGTQLGYTKESDWGVTPSTPPWQIVRMTGESFEITRETIQSAEITPNRGITDLIHVSGGAGGGFNFELSYGTYDDLFASLLYGAWNSNVLKNGTTQSSFSFEEKFLVDAGSYNYLRYTGMIPNSMSMSIANKAAITGAFDFLGKGGSVSDAAVASATYVDPTETPILSGSAHMGTITFGSFATAKISKIDFNITNKLMAANVIGSLENADIGAGQFEVTGNMEIYYEDKSIYEAFLNETEISLSLTMGKTTGNKYTIEFPRIKISAANVTAPQQDQYVMLPLSFQALQDPTEDATIIVTRAVA